MKNSFSGKQKFRFVLTSYVKRFHYAGIIDNTNKKTFSSLSGTNFTSVLPVPRLHKPSPAFIIFEQQKMSINQASSVREISHHEIN
jgi:hypothetical protein